jgi:DNA-binding NtrC family response regulator
VLAVSRPRTDDPDATERQARLERPAVAFPAFRITVSDGPDRGKSIDVVPGAASTAFVGKSDACDLVLSDREVSRRHLALDLEEAGLRVRDLDSTNGTMFAGLSIRDALLRGGEQLRIGSTDLSIELAAAATTVRFPPVDSFGRVLGGSVAMRRLYPLLQRLSATDVPLLIEGETGTGKELVAEALHEVGPRSARPFVVFDWQAIDPKNADRLLFGEESREKGKPKRSAGVFEEASGGTLVIDEIAELPLTVQAKLLRVLESKEVMPVSGDRWIPVSARVVALTSRDLERAVELRKFREDLFYRLVVGRITLPPLRARTGDETLLADHFWRASGAEGSPPADLFSAYSGYAWPGNVRELANVVQRRALGVVAMDASSATPPLVSEQAFQRVLDMDLTLPRAREEVVAAFERCYLQRAIVKHGGNITRAAAASGIARRYFNVLRTRHRSG